ncbi:MAG: hypothetical protein ABIH01_00590 [Candidatus Omnitrophota bacterium]
MSKKIIALALFIAVATGMGLYLNKLYSQEEELSSDISSKLDALLKNDEQIMKMLKEMKQELAVIKIRATR